MACLTSSETESSAQEAFLHIQAYANFQRSLADHIDAQLRYNNPKIFEADRFEVHNWEAVIPDFPSWSSPSKKREEAKGKKKVGRKGTRNMVRKTLSRAGSLPVESGKEGTLRVKRRGSAIPKLTANMGETKVKGVDGESDEEMGLATPSPIRTSSHLNEEITSPPSMPYSYPSPVLFDFSAYPSTPLDQPSEYQCDPSFTSPLNNNSNAENYEEGSATADIQHSPLASPTMNNFDAEFLYQHERRRMSESDFQSGPESRKVLPPRYYDFVEDREFCIPPL